MNRIIVFPNEAISTTGHIYQILRIDVINHIYEILQKIENDTVKVTLLGIGLADGKILSLSKTSLQLELQNLIFIEGKQQHPELLIGYCRPQQGKRIIELSTSMGIRGIHFFQSALCDTNYLKSKIYRSEFNPFFELGLSQSGEYTQRPFLKNYPYSPFRSFSHKALKIVFDMNGGTWPKLDLYSKPIFCFGPERGFTQSELKILESEDFISVKLHPSVLRLEAAVICALSQYHYIKNTSIN